MILYVNLVIKKITALHSPSVARSSISMKKRRGATGEEREEWRKRERGGEVDTFITSRI